MSTLNFSTEAEQISPTIFRAYDIRGIFEETLTTDAIYQIGLALGSEAKSRGINKIITGRDGRYSSPFLSLAFQQGILATGCDIIDIGAVPTPVLYFATHFLETNSGAMITGSHNPAEYNGIKMVLNGSTLTQKEIKKLYQRIQSQDYEFGHGNIIAQDVVNDYHQRILSDVKLSRPLKVVVDCANGVAGDIVPELLRDLGCEVIKLFCDVDGTFPNHEPDPGQPENLQALIKAVEDNTADIGLAFDGDADRLGVVTNAGEIIWPDRIMMLFVKDILKQNSGANIIFDVKCSRNLSKIIEAHNGQPIMWRTGHSLVKAKMVETNALFAGEMSGHFFFKHRWYGFDDGIYAAARLLEILSKYTQSSSSIFQTLPNSVCTPELKLALSEDEKFEFMTKFLAQAEFPNADISYIDGIRVDFPEGWGLIRPSNTTPNLILRFEADSESNLENIKAQFRQQLKRLDENLDILF
ncbi:MAG: phosphomannomutase/phosphoglucomutase [Gammaproteobacteria bacterium]